MGKDGNGDGLVSLPGSAPRGNEVVSVDAAASFRVIKDELGRAQARSGDAPAPTFDLSTVNFLVELVDQLVTQVATANQAVLTAHAAVQAVTVPDRRAEVNGDVVTWCGRCGQRLGG